MLDVLLDAGADINARSRWWAGGFGLLDCASPDLAAHVIERGAAVTVHAAARLGMLERLRDLIEADPAQVHARGGDGQTPFTSRPRSKLRNICSTMERILTRAMWIMSPPLRNIWSGHGRRSPDI